MVWEGRESGSGKLTKGENGPFNASGMFPRRRDMECNTECTKWSRREVGGIHGISGGKAVQEAAMGDSAGATDTTN